MNRFTYIIAFTLLLAACSKESNLPQTGNQIVIEPGITNAKALQEWSIDGAAGTDRLLAFGIYAYYDGLRPIMGDAKGGLEVSRPDEHSEWIYSPSIYWPSSGSIDFYGYAPIGDSGRTSGPGDEDEKWKRSLNSNTTPPTIDFIVDGYPEYQIDLLLAVPQKNQTKQMQAVKMPLRHALTKITFSARIAAELAAYADQVKVDEIRLEGLSAHGTILMDATAEWDITTNPTLRKYTLERSPALGTHSAELRDIALSDSYQNISTREGVLLMLPQPMDEAKTVSITYSITKDGNTQTKSMTSLPLHLASPSWRKGDAINYLILINKDGIVLTIFGLPGSPE